MSGVSLATGQALVYPETRLGFLDARGASPHQMGAGWEGALPECPICEMPATRVLTIDAGAAQLAAPSFFWSSCQDDAFDYICVQSTLLGEMRFEGRLFGQRIDEGATVVRGGTRRGSRGPSVAPR